MKENMENHLLICGPTKSGKTRFLIHILRKELKNVFSVIILICSTYRVNDEFKNFANGDIFFLIMIPDKNDNVEECLKICEDLFYDNKNDKILIILDDVAFTKDVKNRSGMLSKMSFIARHNNIFIYVITQQKIQSVKHLEKISGF